MRRDQQFIYGQVTWMLATVLVLTFVGALSIELFFIGSLVGLLVLTELTASVNIAPKWRSRLKWILLAGMIVFIGFIMKRVIEFLPPRLL